MRTLVSQSLSSVTAPGPSKNSPKLDKFLMDILVSDFLQYFNSFAENQENKVLSNFILVITTYFTTAHHQTEAEVLNKQQECIKQLQPSSASIRAAKVGDSTKMGDFFKTIDRKSLAVIKNSCGFRENLFYFNINTISLDNNNIL